jgi:uncharacterized protein YkwD
MEYKAVLIIRRITIFLVLINLIFVGTSLYITSASDDSKPDSNNISIITEINEIRREHALPEVIYDSRLHNTACYKASDMFNNNYFSHIYTDNAGIDKPFKNMDYRYDKMGENLSRNYTNENVVNAWKNSPAHLAIILGDFQNIAFCRAGNYAVLHLATFD